jgi:hypothetical protein
MSVDQVKETLLSHSHSKFQLKRRLIVENITSSMKIQLGMQIMFSKYDKCTG